MTSTRKKILLLDTGREWGGGTNSMLELLKRIDRQRFAITCCFYQNYARGNQETIASVLDAIGIPVIFIAQRRQPLWAKITKELLRTLLFFNRAVKKAPSTASIASGACSLTPAKSRRFYATVAMMRCT